MDDHGKIFAYLLFASILAIGVFSVSACSDLEDPAGEAAQPAAASPSAASAGNTQAAAAGSYDQTVEAVGLMFELPEGWQEEPPESQMRAAQASIAGSAGPGQLTVFHFGPGGGGGIDANLDRWAGQVEGEPAVRETLESGDLTIHWIDKSGTLKASTLGSYPPHDVPDGRLLGAVVEGPGGPWFLRAVGPGATMEEQREPFLAMLREARVGG